MYLMIKYKLRIYDNQFNIILFIYLYYIIRHIIFMSSKCQGSKIIFLLSFFSPAIKTYLIMNSNQLLINKKLIFIV